MRHAAVHTAIAFFSFMKRNGNRKWWGRPGRILGGTLLFIALWAPPAAADQILDVLRTYYTYGDFEIVCNTFQRIALMMKDANILGLYGGLLVAALVLGSIIGLFKGMLHGGGRGAAVAPIKAAAMAVLSMVLFNFAIANKTTMVVYDQTLNLQRPIPDVPEGLVMLAGFANKIETALVQSIWTTGDVKSFTDNPGGMVFEVMRSLFEKPVDLSGVPGGQDLQRSLRAYMETCVDFEMNRPGTTLTKETLAANTDMAGELAKAASNALFCNIYTPNSATGQCVTCEAAWAHIRAELTEVVREHYTGQFWNEACHRAGVAWSSADHNGNPGTPANPLVNPCQQRTLAMINQILDPTGAATGSIAAPDLTVQYFIAGELHRAISEKDVQSTGSFNTGTAMSGKAAMAAEWIPVIRGMIFAVFIGLFPMLFLLFATPLAGRALSFMVGSFVFLTAWGVCDALIHSYAIDMAINVFDDVARGKLGLSSMLMFKDRSVKALAIFGAGRWSAMMIAGVLASLIAKFGGSAMAHLAGQLGSAGQHGAQAASTAYSPDVAAQKLRSLEGGYAGQAVSSVYGFSGLSQAAAYNSVKATEAARLENQYLGGGNFMLAGQNAGLAGAFRQVHDYNRAQAIGMDRAAYHGAVQGKMESVSAESNARNLDQFGEKMLLESQSMTDRGRIVGNMAAWAFKDYLKGFSLMSPQSQEYMDRIYGMGSGGTYLKNALRGYRLTANEDMAATLNNMISENPKLNGIPDIKAGQSVMLDADYNPNTKQFSLNKLRVDDKSGAETGIENSHAYKTVESVANKFGEVNRVKNPGTGEVVRSSMNGTYTTETVEGPWLIQRSFDGNGNFILGKASTNLGGQVRAFDIGPDGSFLSGEVKDNIVNFHGVGLDNRGELAEINATLQAYDLSQISRNDRSGYSNEFVVKDPGSDGRSAAVRMQALSVKDKAAVVTANSGQSFEINKDVTRYAAGYTGDVDHLKTMHYRNQRRSHKRMGEFDLSNRLESAENVANVHSAANQVFENAWKISLMKGFVR